MQQYGTEDLVIVEDPLSLIRRRPLMYGGNMPRGPAFASWLVRDLVFLDVLPASVERLDKWWIVSAGHDWLVSKEGGVSMEPFFRFMPLPSAGHAAHRTEILINAFAEAVFTAGSNGLTWISGDQNRYPVPIQLIENPPKIGCGRYVAFRIDEP